MRLLGNSQVTSGVRPTMTAVSPPTPDRLRLALASSSRRPRPRSTSAPRRPSSSARSRASIRSCSAQARRSASSPVFRLRQVRSKEALLVPYSLGDEGLTLSPLHLQQATTRAPRPPMTRLSSLPQDQVGWTSARPCLPSALDTGRRVLPRPPCTNRPCWLADTMDTLVGI